MKSYFQVYFNLLTVNFSEKLMYVRVVKTKKIFLTKEMSFLCREIE